MYQSNDHEPLPKYKEERGKIRIPFPLEESSAFFEQTTPHTESRVIYRKLSGRVIALFEKSKLYPLSIRARDSGQRNANACRLLGAYIGEQRGKFKRQGPPPPSTARPLIKSNSKRAHGGFEKGVFRAMTVRICGSSLFHANGNDTSSQDGERPTCPSLALSTLRCEASDLLNRTTIRAYARATIRERGRTSWSRFYYVEGARWCACTRAPSSARAGCNYLKLNKELSDFISRVTNGSCPWNRERRKIVRSGKRSLRAEAPSASWSIEE
ncbi:hypothetical protein KM043_017394 [Ampulex compressa]|nr:hypothetical protein KM043_017394 [Ampulex compressa]